VEVVSHDATADFHEDVLNAYLQSQVAAAGVLIMALADVLGAVAVLAALVVTTLTAKFITVAGVFFTPALDGLIILNGGG